MNSPLDFDSINRAALPLLPAILMRLVPGGKTVAGEYIVRNPTRADRHAGSFRINIRSGRWADFATGDRGGDVIALLAYLENLPQADAARALADMIGYDIGGRRCA
jgi:hypothetical protein